MKKFFKKISLIAAILLGSYITYAFARGSLVKVFISSYKFKYIETNNFYSSSDLISSVVHENGVEYGLLRLEDGSVVHFWFSSHHLHKGDIGTTKFEFSDNDTDYMHGYFCCSVEIPAKYLKDIPSLKNFITSNTGLSP